MFTNRISKIFVVLLILAVAFVGVSFATRSANIPAADQDASDFYQRHPEWTWTIGDASVVIPVTGASAYPDYYQRHPELSVRAETASDTTDYFFRHPELMAPANSIDFTDYYFRHPDQ